MDNMNLVGIVAAAFAAGFSTGAIVATILTVRRTNRLLRGTK